MSPAPERREVVLYSEDRNKDTRKALKVLLQRLLPAGNVEVRLNEAKRFGNWWASTKGEDEQDRRQLWNAIATELRLGKVVVFHYDADVVWSQRKHAGMTRQFANRMRLHVAQVLEGAKPVVRSAHPRARDSQATEPHPSPRLLLEGLIECVPHYELEAWFYQATEVAAHKCAAEHQKPEHIHQYEAWQRDRRKIDEVKDPKGSCCLGDRFNHELAQELPLADALAAGTSLAAFYECLKACPSLTSFVFRPVSPSA